MSEQTQVFGSLADMADYCETAPRLWDEPYASDARDDNGWSGTESLQQAIDFARNGQWQCPDMDMLRGVVNMPESREYEQRLTWEQDVVGVRPNVPAYLAGEPCNMWSPIYADSERKIVRILLNRSYPWQVTAETAVQHGALVLELINRLETEYNLTTELSVIVPATLRNLSHETICVIKRAGQPLDLSEIAFAIACPSFLRRLIFRLYEALPKQHQTSSYGMPYEPGDATRAEYDLYLPAPNSDLSNVKAAIKKAMTDGSIIRVRTEEQP